MLQILIRLLIKTCIFFFLIPSCVLQSASAYAVITLDRATVDLELAGNATPIHRLDVGLPYHWNRLHGATDGQASFFLEFLSSAPETSQALFIPRLGNTYEVKLNGVLIEKMGVPGNMYEDYSKQPKLFLIPNGILRSSNTINIRINAQGGREGGLSPVFLGPTDEIRELYQHSRRWRGSGFFVVSIVSLVLGTLALLLWLRQRELVYVFYGLGELLFAFRISDAQFDHSPLPWPWWGAVGFSVQGISSILLMKFALLVMHQHRGGIKRICDWHLVLTIPAAALTLFGGWTILSSIWMGFTALLVFIVSIKIIPQGLRGNALEKRALALAFIAINIAAVRDVFIFRILPGYYGVIWTVYAWVFFGISLAWIIAERLRKSTRAISHMNLTLSQRLIERELELNAAFALQADSARHQAMLEERQRFTRDMHDGLGSQLMGALQLAQNPAVSKEMLTEQLRETLDHLKMTVDAMQDTEGDIASLLGALRYRLNPRLTAAGVRLAWSVEPLPEIAGWTLQKSRDLQLILFEAFTNLMVHACATDATLYAAQDAEQRCIRIVLQDNGQGFDMDAMATAGGHGLANMRTRAVRIGADLQIESTPEGTRIDLVLPLDKAAPP